MDWITHEQLNGLISYDPETGVFTWVVRRGHISAGTVAGSKDKDGYVKVRVANKCFQAHRLAWFYVTGCWPDGEIDHINGVHSDNRFANLRVVSSSQNKQNLGGAKSHNKCGFLGVSVCQRSSKFRAQIKQNGTITYLGTYQSAEDAHIAYLEAKKRLHTHADRMLGV